MGILSRFTVKYSWSSTPRRTMVSFTSESFSADLFINKKSKATLENAPVMLRAAIETLSAIENWQVDTIHDALIALAQRLEVKNGTLLWPVRIAAAGQTVTPGGAMEILAVLGKEEALRRLQLGLQKIENA